MKKLCLSAALVCLSVTALAGSPKAVVRGAGARVQDGKASADISLTLTGTTFADLEMFDSTITKFISDKGDNLGAKPEGMPDYEKMPSYASIQKWGDGETNTVTIRSPLKVSGGATKFTVAGVLILKHAEKLEKMAIKDLKIQNKVEVTVAGVKGFLKEVKRTDDELEFSLEFPEIPTGFEFEDIELLDQKGEELRGGRSGQTTKYGDGPEKTSIWFYGIKPPVETLTFEYSMWKNLQAASVPYEVTASTDGKDAGSAVTVVLPGVAQAPAAAQTAPAVKATVAQPAQSPAQTGQAPEKVEQAPAQTSGWPALKISAVAGKGPAGSVIVNGKMYVEGETVSGTAVKVQSIGGGIVVLKLGKEVKKLKSGESVK